jgi:hypothetical protein
MVISAQPSPTERRHERRRHKRAGVMVPALLDQMPVTISDLSLGGIGAGSIEILYDGEMVPSRGQQASLRFFDGLDEVSENIEVEIVRVSSSRGELGARYVNLTEEQKAFITRLLAKT